jgi:hypothetical protein
MSTQDSNSREPAQRGSNVNSERRRFLKTVGIAAAGAALPFRASGMSPAAAQSTQRVRKGAHTILPEHFRRSPDQRSQIRHQHAEDERQGVRRRAGL